MKKISIISFFLLILVSGLVAAKTTAAPAKHNVNLYFFYGDGCPHCAKAEPYLKTLEQKYPELTVTSYETWYNKSNSDLFAKMSAACGVEIRGVPSFFIGHKNIVGFDNPEGKGAEIEKEIVKFINEGGDDLMQTIGQNLTSCPSEKQKKFNAPFIGELDATKISLPLLTVVLGTLDGFNACAMFVLLILIGILLRTQSRKRMAVIAGTFVFASGAVYFLFMTVWLNAFIFAGHFRILFWIVGGIAIITGIINLKDFFFFKKGPSLAIPEKAKSKIFAAIRKIVNAESLLIMMITVIFLAVSVNFVEFLCTFGFPMVFTNVLATAPIPAFMKYFYLALYQVFYMLDDTIIVIIAIWTLSSKKMTEKYGRLIKLISGLIILILGIILLLKPNLLMGG